MAIAHTEQKNRRATMKDVARRAGVTIGTVSHVINGTAPISEETTARVREAIRELNYVLNLAARHMRRKEKRQIGLLIPKLDNNFYARIASVLMEDAYQEDYTVLMLSYEYSSEKEKRGLVNMVQNDTETIVIVNGEDDENSIRKLVASGFHVILADRRSTIPGTSYIAYDNHQVLRAAQDQQPGRPLRGLSGGPFPVWMSLPARACVHFRYLPRGPLRQRLPVYGAAAAHPCAARTA